MTQRILVILPVQICKTILERDIRLQMSMTQMISILNKNTFIARKGPRKYFAIKPEYLKDDKVFLAEFDPSQAHDDRQFHQLTMDLAIRNYIFSPVYKSLNAGNEVEVYKSTFTIGEHAQISWFDSEMLWVVASQHATIFMRNSDDLEAYKCTTSSPYYAPVMIAQHWLNFFNKKVTDKETFQKAINGKTLCATYIDKEKFDCLLRYENPVLVFHAIVENDDIEGNCIVPDQSYAFFQKWSLQTAPLTRIDQFTNFESLGKDLTQIQDSVSNSTLEDNELGAVLYFVQKGENEKVLSMAKINSKDAQFLKLLIKTLKIFWKKNEDVQNWNNKLENEYNAIFNNYMYQVEEAGTPHLKHYFEIGQTAFKFLKEDIDLYEKLKTNIPDFLDEIYKNKITKQRSQKSFNDSAKEGSFKKVKKNSRQKQKESYEDKEISIPRSEDAIDRLMKNEHIRKQSNIDQDDETPLEDIIGSQKLQPESTPKSRITKKRKSKVGNPKTIKTPKNNKEENKKSSKNHDVQENKQEVKKSVEVVDINQEFFEEASIPMPEEIRIVPEAMEFTKTAQKPSSRSSLQVIKMRAGYVDSKLVSEDKVQRYLILDPTFEIDQQYDDSEWDTEQVLEGCKDNHHYLGVIFEGNHMHDQLFLIPYSFKLGGHSQRLFGPYSPFGFRQSRKIITQKSTNKRVQVIVFQKKIQSNLLWHTFDEEALWYFNHRLSLRSYKSNPLLNFNNVTYWFAQFRVFSDFFRNTHSNFVQNIQRTVIPAKCHLYNILHCAWAMPSTASTIPVFNLAHAAEKDFTQHIAQFIRAAPKSKSKNNKKSFLEKNLKSLSKFYSKAPLNFWRYLYNPELTIETEVQYFSNTSKSMKSTVKKKKNKMVEKQDLEFKSLFQEAESELENSLRASMSSENESTKRAFVTSMRRRKGGEKSNFKKQQIEQQREEKFKQDQAIEKKLKQFVDQDENKKKRERERNVKVQKDTHQKTKKKPTEKEVTKKDQAKGDNRKNQTKGNNKVNQAKIGKEMKQKDPIDKGDQEVGESTMTQNAANKSKLDAAKKPADDKQTKGKSKQGQAEQKVKEEKKAQVSAGQKAKNEVSKKVIKEVSNVQSEESGHEIVKNLDNRVHTAPNENIYESSETFETQVSVEETMGMNKGAEKAKVASKKGKKAAEKGAQGSKQAKKSIKKAQEGADEAKEEVDRIKQEQATKAKEEADKKTQQEQKVKDDADRKAKADLKAQQTQEAKDVAEKNSKDEAVKKAREEQKAHEIADQKLKKAAQEKANKEAKQMKKEAEKNHKEELRLKEEAEQKHKDELRLKEEAEQKRKEEVKLKKEADQKHKEEVRLKKEVEQKHKEELRLKEEVEQKHKDELRLKEEAEKKHKEELRLKEEVEQKHKEELRLKEEAEKKHKEELRLKEEVEQKHKEELKLREEAEHKHKEEFKLKEDADKKHKEELRLKHEIEQKLKEDSEQKHKEELKTKKEASKKAKADAKAKIDADLKGNQSSHPLAKAEKQKEQKRLADDKLQQEKDRKKQLKIEKNEAEQKRKKELIEKKEQEKLSTQLVQKAELEKQKEQEKLQEFEKKAKERIKKKIEDEKKQEIALRKKHEKETKALDEVEEGLQNHFLETERMIQVNNANPNMSEVKELEKRISKQTKSFNLMIDENSDTHDQVRLAGLKEIFNRFTNNSHEQIIDIKQLYHDNQLDEVENNQKAQMQMIRQEIEEQKHQQDLQRLDEIEQKQKIVNKSVQDQIKNQKKNTDQQRLQFIEEQQKHNANEIFSQIQQLREQIDHQKLSEIEQTQKLHMQELMKEIGDHKQTQNLQKLNEIEKIQKEHASSVKEQIKQNRKTYDQQRLNNIQDRQKDNAKLVREQIERLRESAQKRDQVIESPKKAFESDSSNPFSPHKSLQGSNNLNDSNFNDISITVTPIRPSRASHINRTTVTLTSESKRKGNSSFRNSMNKSMAKSTSKSPFGGRSLRRSRLQRLNGHDCESQDRPFYEEEEKVPTTRNSVVTKKLKKVTTSMTGTTPVSRKTYTKKSMNAKNSVKSSSAMKKSGEKKVQTSRGIKTTVFNASTGKMAKPSYTGLTPKSKSLKKELTSAFCVPPGPIAHSISTSSVSLKDVYYLGLKPTEEDIASTLNQQTYDALNKINEKYPSPKLDEMIAAFETGTMEELGWNTPMMPYHITTSLINGKATVKSRKAIEQFKIGIEEKLDLKSIIIVEDLFIATAMTPKLVESSSKIPYMAIWMNNSKPKDCTKVLEHLLYKIKESMKHGEEKLRSYYSIQNKAMFKDDVVGNISMVFDTYREREVWYCFIKDSEKINFESFIKKIDQ